MEILEVLQTLNDGGLTILMVTYEQHVSQFAKRRIVLRNGKIRKDEVVTDRPRARAVLETLPQLD